MGIIGRQGLKGSIAIYIGLAIGYVNLLFVFPYCLTDEEIGLVKFFQNIGLLFSMIAALGMSNVLPRFYAYFDRPKEQSTFLLIVFGVPLIGSVLVASSLLIFKDLFLSYFQENATLLVDYYGYLLPLTFLVTVFVMLMAYSRVQDRIVVPSIIFDVLIRMAVTGVVICYFFHVFDLDGMFVWMFVFYGIGALILLGYVFRLAPIRLGFFRSFFQNPKAREIWPFALFILLQGTSGMLMTNIDNLMISSVKGLDYMGVYSIAFTLAMLVEVPRRGIAQIAYPVLNRQWKNNNWNEIRNIFLKSSENQLLAGGLLFLIVWSNVDELFALMPREETFVAGKYVILFVCLGKLIEVTCGLTGEIIAASRYYRFSLLFVLILAFLTIWTNYLFIPKYGIVGAGLATGISIVLFSLIRLGFVYAKFKLHPFTHKTLLLIGLLLLGFVIGWLIPSVIHPVVAIAIRSMAILVVLVPLILRFGLADDLVPLLTNQLTALFKKS